MASTPEKPNSPPNRRVIAARRRRVAQLERDPEFMAAIREGLESERLGRASGSRI